MPSVRAGIAQDAACMAGLWLTFMGSLPAE
jgi:hypothetical protein